MGRTDAVRILKGEHLSDDSDQPKYERYVAVRLMMALSRKEKVIQWNCQS